MTQDNTSISFRTEVEGLILKYRLWLEEDVLKGVLGVYRENQRVPLISHLSPEGVMTVLQLRDDIQQRLNVEFIE